MTTESQAPTLRALPLFEALFAGQPRAVRLFSENLDILFDNTPRRDALYPIFRGPHGELIPVPTQDNARRIWPVEQVRMGFPRAERNYIATPEGAVMPFCFRVQAWPYFNPATRERLIVEEMERMPDTGQRDCVEHLDREVELLLHDVVEYLERGPNGHVPRLRLSNPNLQPCHEVKGCTKRKCPAHQLSTNMRCWEIKGTVCPGIDNHDPVTKFNFCSECEVFLMACPDPLSRVAENLNRLISILQMKFQEALEAQMQLQQADKLAVLGELLAGIAHEIKNPLGIIMGRVDCLTLEMDTLEKEDIEGDLAVISDQALRVRTIIDHLLEMASPNPANEMQELSLNDIIHETLPMVRKVLKDAGVKLSVSLEHGLPRVRGDAVQIQQVLINLILNARDAMPDGGDLTIVTSPVGTPAKEVQITVEDTGTGMTKQELDRIFTAFYTTKKDKGGTGLGLTICQRIMRRHNGRIQVESTANRGTTMRLVFPARHPS